LSVRRLQADAIRPEALLSAIGSPADGAVALFLGTVRDTNRGRLVEHLEYEAYEAMAEAEIERIVRDARGRFAVSGVEVVHRLGRLEIGEIAVAVAVAAPHRDAAFEACRFVIDAVKHSVPIWKKEVWDGGEVWIEGAGETPAVDQPKSTASRSSSSIPR
jgi:molybdopterin synthase catalytic subunit